MAVLTSKPSLQLAPEVAKSPMEMVVLLGVTAPTILPTYRCTKLQSRAPSKAATSTKMCELIVPLSLRVENKSVLYFF